MDYSIIAEYFIFFIAFSALGWALESIWVAIQNRKMGNRGFLIGPICPIYGFGALFIVLIASHLASSPALVFLVSALGCATLEYSASFMLEKMFNARWWDYTKRRFNLRGRICLDYVIVFGLGGLFIVYLAWPFFHSIFVNLPTTLVYIISATLFFITFLDFLISTSIIKSFKKISRRTPVDDTEDITTYVRQVLAAQGFLYRRLNNFNFIITRRPRVYRYREFTDDFVKGPRENYQLPKNYRWIRRHSRPLLYTLARAWAGLHHFFTGTRYHNRKILLPGSFIYANHTQPIADILRPVHYCGSHRPRLVASPDNLGLPIVGPLLPDLGALPVPSSLHDFPKFQAAIQHYAQLGSPIIIYPEAHVWPYYTGIRPLPVSAFRFPVVSNAPCFTATTVYRRRRFRAKPRQEIYFDGPFYPDPALSPRAAAGALCEQITASLKKSARKSNCKYIKYVKKS